MAKRFEGSHELEDLPVKRGDTVSPPQVCWAGEGSYWHDVDINDVPEAQKP